MPEVELEVRSSPLTPEEQRKLQSSVTFARVAQVAAVIFALGLAIMFWHDASVAHHGAPSDDFRAQLPAALTVLAGAASVALVQRMISKLRTDLDTGFANEHTGSLTSRSENKGSISLHVSGRRFTTDTAFMRRTPERAAIYHATLPTLVRIRFAPLSGTLLDIHAVTPR